MAGLNAIHPAQNLDRNDLARIEQLFASMAKFAEPVTQTTNFAFPGATEVQDEKPDSRPITGLRQVAYSPSDHYTFGSNQNSEKKLGNLKLTA